MEYSAIFFVNLGYEYLLLILALIVNNDGSRLSHSQAETIPIEEAHHCSQWHDGMHMHDCQSYDTCLMLSYSPQVETS